MVVQGRRPLTEVKCKKANIRIQLLWEYRNVYEQYIAITLLKFYDMPRIHSIRSWTSGVSYAKNSSQNFAFEFKNRN